MFPGYQLLWMALRRRQKKTVENSMYGYTEMLCLESAIGFAGRDEMKRKRAVWERGM